MKTFPICALIFLLSFIFSCNKSDSDGDTGFLINPTISDPYSSTVESTFSLSYDVVGYDAATLRRYSVVYQKDSAVGMACAVYSNNPGTYGNEVIKVIFYLSTPSSLPDGNGTILYSGTGTVIVKYCTTTSTGDTPTTTPQSYAMKMGSSTGAIAFSITRSGNSYTASGISLPSVNGKAIAISGTFPVIRE